MDDSLERQIGDMVADGGGRGHHPRVRRVPSGRWPSWRPIEGVGAFETRRLPERARLVAQYPEIENVWTSFYVKGTHDEVSYEDMAAMYNRLRAEVERLSAAPDEAAIERAAESLSIADGGPLRDWLLVDVEIRERYRSLARLVIAALRGETR